MIRPIRDVEVARGINSHPPRVERCGSRGTPISGKIGCPHPCGSGDDLSRGIHSSNAVVIDDIEVSETVDGDIPGVTECCSGRRTTISSKTAVPAPRGGGDDLRRGIHFSNSVLKNLCGVEISGSVNGYAKTTGECRERRRPAVIRSTSCYRQNRLRAGARAQQGTPDDDNNMDRHGQCAEHTTFPSCSRDHGGPTFQPEVALAAAASEYRSLPATPAGTVPLCAAHPTSTADHRSPQRQEIVKSDFASTPQRGIVVAASHLFVIKSSMPPTLPRSVFGS